MATLMARSIVDTTVFVLYSARDNAVRDRGTVILIHTVTPLFITVYITVDHIIEAGAAKRVLRYTKNFAQKNLKPIWSCGVYIFLALKIREKYLQILGGDLVPMGLKIEVALL
jgi:hypothetical protein